MLDKSIDLIAQENMAYDEEPAILRFGWGADGMLSQFKVFKIIARTTGCTRSWSISEEDAKKMAKMILGLEG